MNGSLDDLYLRYLYDYVGLPKRGRNRTYWKLFQQMYAKEFVWLIPQDSSRAEDVQELRWEFTRAAGLSRVQAAWLYKSCSILEMVIFVARRIAFITDDDFRPWFLQLLYNLRLDYNTDHNFDGHIIEIDEKLESLIWRTYLPNGEGGLFPLQNPAVDQRNVEIWNQMNAWLIERERREA